MSEASASPALDLGAVLRAFRDLLRRRLWLFVALALPLAGVPAILLLIAQTQAGPLSLALGVAAPLLMTAAGVVGNSLAGAAISFAALEDLQGRRPSFAASVAAAFRFFLPVAVINVIVWFCMSLGLFLLVVPGVMVAAAWLVPVQVVLAERIGIFPALDRSRDLTRNNRLRLVGLMALYMVGFFALGVGVTLASGADLFPGAAMDSNWLWLALNGLTTSLSAVVAGAGLSVVYAELRKLHEGGMALNDLAEVFS